MLTLSRLLSPLPLLPLLWLAASLSPLSGCTAAPLQGKACSEGGPADASDACALGYACCRSTNRCLAPGESCPCSLLRLNDPTITTGGQPLAGEPQPTEVLGQLAFNTSSGQWVSYSYLSDDQMPPIAQVISEVTSERDGFHVTATFDTSTQTPTSYEGFGLTFRLADTCIDGAQYTGVQFDFTGDLGGRPLVTGVTSADDVSITRDAKRGTCTKDPVSCYGPNYSPPDINGMSQTPVKISVPFALLQGGSPNHGLDRGKIVNVQWQLVPAANPVADFMIRSVTFY